MLNMGGWWSRCPPTLFCRRSRTPRRRRRHVMHIPGRMPVYGGRLRRCCMLLPGKCRLFLSPATRATSPRSPPTPSHQQRRRAPLTLVAAAKTRCARRRAAPCRYDAPVCRAAVISRHAVHVNAQFAATTEHALRQHTVRPATHTLLSPARWRVHAHIRTLRAASLRCFTRAQAHPAAARGAGSARCAGKAGGKGWYAAGGMARLSSRQPPVSRCHSPH